MNSMDSGSWAFDDGSDEKENKTPHAHSGEVTTGGNKETQWEVVSETMGIAPAEIIAQRLQTEGIPARAWQEGAGQAFGLTVGLLGTGYVMVPEPYAEKAREILEASDDDFEGYGEE
jgi:hypothetical protein